LRYLTGNASSRNIIFKREVVGNIQHHLVQSRYAGDFLKRKNVCYGYLSDYLNEGFLKKRSGEPARKKDQVVYNPRKGFEFTKKIIAAAQDITWIPIISLQPAEVISLLEESKVYIDFGHHPGKDRIPREAAIMKCCVITGRRGAAGNPHDIPIRDSYKIADRTANIPAIVGMIRSCLSDYDSHVADFKPYRDWIYREENKFIEDIQRVFKIRYNDRK
jgi:hypothetical protein